MARRFAEAEASGRSRAELTALALAFSEYERDLALIGLTDEQVCADDRPGRRRLALAWSIDQGAGRAAGRRRGDGRPRRALPDHEEAGHPAATTRASRPPVKLLGCFVLFTVVYVILGVVTGETWGPWAGLGAALAPPPAATPRCGWPNG